MPKRTPPAAAATSVTEPSAPPAAAERPSSARIAGNAIANSVTSKASSIHPSPAAISALRACGVPSAHHDIRRISESCDRSHLNTCCFQALAEGGGEAGGAGSVAVDADGVDLDGNVGAVAGANP